MKPKVKIDRAVLKKIERDVEKKMSGMRIPASGSESAAVASLKKQMKDRGVTPNDSAVKKLVREARADDSE